MRKTKKIKPPKLIDWGYMKIKITCTDGNNYKYKLGKYKSLKAAKNKKGRDEK